MSEQPWLTRYFTKKDLKNLNPITLFDGKKYAVIRIQQGQKVAFLGVFKDGRNNLTTAEPLHEGGADTRQLKKMKTWLIKKDRR